MDLFNGKKFLLIGVVIALLVAIPFTIFSLQQNQETRSQAQKATKLYFSLPEQLMEQTSPVVKKVNDTFSIDVVANPGTNFISFAKLAISYDTSKLATQGAGIEPITTGAQGLPSVLEGPTFENGTISITLSVGADPTKVIQQPTKIAKLTFKALSATGGSATEVKFLDTQTQILSAPPNCQNNTNCQDQPSENVLQATSPVKIDIQPAVSTPSASTTPAANAAPTCSGLSIDRIASGPAPFSVTFTANGRDTDGTISKVTFNFGDGPVQDITQTGGIGTNSVSVPVSHTYNNPGTFQASAILTDNQGAISTTACTQTITVSGRPIGAGGAGGTAPTATPAGGMTQPTAIPTAVPTTAPVDPGTKGGISPTMSAPGAGDTFLTVGVIGAILSIVGALTFFAL